MIRALVATLGITALLAAQAGLAPYDADVDHPANRIFRAIYVVELVPDLVSAALPGEHGDDNAFYQKGWYFAQRAGTAADLRVFGGDGRQMPRERFARTAAATFAAHLAAIDGEVTAELKKSPRRAVYLQHDLLRLGRRLLDTKANPELLAPLLAAAERLALPAATLRDSGLATFALAQVEPHLIDCTPDDLVEVDRRSSRLFDAEYTQLWSKAHFAVPEARALTTGALLTALADADKAAPPAVPLGTTAVLVQGITALDDQGTARATPLVIDVRIQRFANADPLGAENDTTTRDGVDFWQWLLPRQRVREAEAGRPGLAAFRAVPMSTEELFRDYGSLKHTTYAAQCSLCHRRTHTPDGALAGFSALRPTSQPRIAEPGARERLAERQLERFLTRLR